MHLRDDGNAVNTRPHSQRRKFTEVYGAQALYRYRINQRFTLTQHLLPI